MARSISAAAIAEALGGAMAGPRVALIEEVVDGEPLGRLAAPSWSGRDAAVVRDAVRRRDWAELRSRVPRGIPQFERLAGFFSPDDFVFLDIETMGLSFQEDIFLVGTLRWRQDRWLVRQAVLLSTDRPADLFEQMNLLIDGGAAWATYNGASFDIPFLRFALQRHGLSTIAFDGLFVFDLLHSVRHWYRGLLPNCRLKTVEEELLGVRRLDDVPGYAIPSRFSEFIATRNPAILARILEHNRQDLLSLKEIAKRQMHAQDETGAGVAWIRASP